MYPDNMHSPVVLEKFLNLKGVFDVVYNPLRTKIIMDAQNMGVPAVAGLPMLVAQAKKTHEIFFDTKLEDSITEKITMTLFKEMCNIVLIGMAGCGKTTIGKVLSEKLNKDLMDTDSMIENAEGKPIPEIIENQGEDFFRCCENAAVNLAGREKSSIIATGGGVVTRPENYMPLKQNGIIVFINRDAEKLPTKNRPLSQLHGVKVLCEKRMPLYRQFAHIEVDGNGTVEEVTNSIIKEIEKI
jgi:shikimate dehydrogenase